MSRILINLMFNNLILKTMGTYLVTSKVNAGNLKQGMSVLIETYQSIKPTQNDIIKAFMEQKGVPMSSALHSNNNFTITEVKK